MQSAAYIQIRTTLRTFIMESNKMNPNQTGNAVYFLHLLHMFKFTSD